MARASGCDLRVILAGAMFCWAAMDGVTAAQDGAEVTEDLGNSYLLARRATSMGSIIETLLFAGQTIVTEIAVPAGPDAGVTTGTTGASAITRTPAGSTDIARTDAGSLPSGMAPGFGGTWLTGEIVGDYLILHRTRASDPVTHEIFHEGRKVGSVTEVDGSVRPGKSPGRNSFAFESIDDRFVVHLTQPDGTRIHATTEHGRLSGQVIERGAAIAAPQRSAVAVPPQRSAVAAPPQPPLEPARPLIGRSAEPQQIARPQEPPGRIAAEEEPTAQSIPALPEAVPLPRAFPYPSLRPTIAPISVQTARPSPPGKERNTPAPMTAAPAGRPKPAVGLTNAPSHSATTAMRPVAPEPTSIARSTRLRAVAPESTTATPPERSRSVAPEPKPVAAPAGAKPTVAAVAARSPATAAAKPSAPAASKAATSAVKPKPAPATANARPSSGVAAKPATAAAKPSKSPASGAASQ